MEPPWEYINFNVKSSEADDGRCSSFAQSYVFFNPPPPPNFGKFDFVHFKSKWRSVNGYMGAGLRGYRALLKIFRV